MTKTADKLEVELLAGCGEISQEMPRYLQAIQRDVVKEWSTVTPVQAQPIKGLQMPQGTQMSILFTWSVVVKKHGQAIPG